MDSSLIYDINDISTTSIEKRPVERCYDLRPKRLKVCSAFREGRPLMAKRDSPPCPAPGCGEVVEGGRCERHRRQQDASDRARRGTSSQRGYDRFWRAAARAFRAQYPCCGMRPDNQRPVMSRCFDQGILTEAQQTDHVVPHRGDKKLFRDQRNNWQSLCARCGAAKSRAGY